MVDQQAVEERQLDQVFGALADAKRRGMLARLLEGPASVSELGAPYSISKQAVTKHVRVLEEAGLIRREVDGRVHRCQLERPSVQGARSWLNNLERYWEAHLDSLEAFLDAGEDLRDANPSDVARTTEEGHPS